MNRDQKKAFFIAVPLGLLMFAGFCMALFSPMPGAKTYDPWIPQEARVLNVEKVRTGTFLATIDKEEMIQRAKGVAATLWVVVTDERHYVRGKGTPKVEYWLPGKGTFDYSRDNVPIPFDRFRWAAVFDPKTNVFNLSPGRSWGGYLFHGVTFNGLRSCSSRCVEKGYITNGGIREGGFPLVRSIISCRFRLRAGSFLF